MAIATTDATGLPDVRMVLLKHADATASSFTPIPNRKKDPANGEHAGSRRLRTGNRCAVKFASGVRLSWLPPPRGCVFRLPAAREPYWRAGQASSPALLKAHTPWKRLSPGKLSVSTSEKCPGLHIGQVIASVRFISSFGPISPSACTTVSCIAVPLQMPGGERRDYIRNLSMYIVLFIWGLAQNALHLEAWQAGYETRPNSRRSATARKIRESLFRASSPVAPARA